MSFSADPLSQHDCTSTSRISPALSTARQGTCADPESRLPSHPDASCPKVEASVPQSAGECRSELEHPPLAVLVRDVEPSLCQEFLDVLVAEREAQVQPDGVPDDLRWELVTDIGDGLHPLILPKRRMARQFSRDSALVAGLRAKERLAVLLRSGPHDPAYGRGPIPEDSGLGHRRRERRGRGSRGRRPRPAVAAWRAKAGRLRHWCKMSTQS
jgi:hypothetical protein